MLTGSLPDLISAIHPPPKKHTTPAARTTQGSRVSAASAMASADKSAIAVCAARFIALGFATFFSGSTAKLHLPIRKGRKPFPPQFGHVQLELYCS